MSKVEIPLEVIAWRRSVKETLLKCKWLFNLYVKLRSRNTRVKNKIKEVENEYTQLIQEFQKIQRGESKLSANERRKVRARVVHLVGKGHIKIS